MMETDDHSGNEPNPYAGRWVARLRGKVVAQGGTPEQALRAAQNSRYKEKPEIIFMTAMHELNFPPLFETIRDILKDEVDVYLVGGAVRDLFLKRPVHDLDFAVKRNAIQLARKVADKLKADFYPLDSDRDTGRILVRGNDGIRQEIDFAVFRGDDLETDLRGRDFSINSMAIDPKDLSLHDPLGGLMDLRDKCIRACSASSFRDDPVRILRGIRFSAAFGFRIQVETRQAMKESADELPKVSAERQRDELFRIFAGPHPAICIKALDILGALEPVLPDLLILKGVLQPSPHVSDVWTHTLNVVSRLESILAALAQEYDPEKASNYYHGLLVLKIGRYRKQLSEHFSIIPNNQRSWREILIFSALYHDIAKPKKAVTGEEGHIRFWGHENEGADIVTAQAHRLVMSNDEINRLNLIVQNHMRIHFHSKRLEKENKMPTRRAIYRFYRDVGEAGIDICLLTLADLWATYENALPEKTWAACLDIVRIFLEAWWEKRSEIISPPTLVNGSDLMRELALEPGPELGRLLEAIREAQATDRVHDTQEAILYARQYLNKLHQGEIKEYLVVDHTRLAFYQRPGNGTPVVLIHGYPLSHIIWQPILPLLEKEARLILPDLRGHGDSQTPEGNFIIDEMAEDIAGLMDFLKIKQAVLIGHSLGGYVALSFARMYPQRLIGLGLVSSRATADNPAQKAAREKMVAGIQAKGMEPVAEVMAGRLVADQKFAPGLRDLILKMDPAGAIGAVRAMAARQDSTIVLAGLKKPGLVIAGAADVLIPLEISQQMMVLSPDILYYEFEGVGHMPMLESPTRTAEAINLLIMNTNLKSAGR
jgi:poly(A) polymerase